MKKLLATLAIVAIAVLFMRYMRIHISLHLAVAGVALLASAFAAYLYAANVLSLRATQKSLGATMLPSLKLREGATLTAVWWTQFGNGCVVLGVCAILVAIATL